MSTLNDRLPVFLRYAWRNLSRNRRRTLLSALGLALGCSVALVDIGLNRGKNTMFIAGVAEGGTGHLSVAPDGWLASRNPSLRLKDWQQVLAGLRQDPAVKVAAPSNRVQALLSMGTRMAGVEVTGVDPEAEPQALRYVRRIQAGRYLQPGESGSLVLGRTLAERLKVGIGDPLVLTVADRQGAVNSAMFQVEGIVDLGGKLDAMICQATLADVDRLSGLPGPELITVLLKHPEDLADFRKALQAHLPAGDNAYTWPEVDPAIAQGVRIDTVFVDLINAVLILICLLGVASAQLTAVLERRREFAMLSAMGMRFRSMLQLLLSEALALGCLSLLGTLALSLPTLGYLAVRGLDLGDAQGLQVAGVALVDTVLRADLGPWIFIDAVLLCFGATLLASLYPGWFARNLDPAEALRVAQ